MAFFVLKEMFMDDFKLKAVIDAEPANAARSDTEVLAWSKEAVTVYGDITWSEFMRWAARYNGINKMEDAKANGTTPAVKSAAASGLMVLDAGQPLQLSIEEVRVFMGSLVTGSVFTVAEKDDLLDFSKSDQERWINEGFRQMGDKSKLVHINAARAL